MIPRIGRALVAVHVLVATCSVLSVAILLAFADRGFDITDEGFYLNWVSRPGLWDTSTTQFGFVYHPLFVMVDGNVTLLRRVTILLTVGLSTWAAHLAVKRTRPTCSRMLTVTVVVAAAAVSLRAYNRWLLTPNYNLLVLHGVLLVTIGLLLWLPMVRHPRSEDERRGKSPTSTHEVAAAAITGLGGTVLFLAKPPSAVAGALLVAAALALTRQFRTRTILIATVTSIASMVTFLLAVDGSPVAFVDRFRSGFREVQLIDGGHSLTEMLRVDGLGLTPLTLGIACGTLATLTLFTWRVSPVIDRRERRLVTLLGCTALFATAAAIAFRPGAIGGNIPTATLLPLAVPLSALVCRLASATRSPNRCTAPTWASNDNVMAGLLVLLPLAITLGTNANSWVAASQYGVLWVLAALVILRPLSMNWGWRATTPTVVACGLLTVIPLVLAMQHPYRQDGPVWNYTTELTVASDSTLRVSQQTGDPINDLMAVAERAGLSPSTGVIDLTGHAPGLVYALGAVPVNSPWVPGGYPGSERLMHLTLARLSCEVLQSAWLLVQPGGPRSVADAFFQASKSADDYVVLGSVTPSNFIGDVGTAQPPIELWRPKGGLSPDGPVCGRSRVNP